MASFLWWRGHATTSTCRLVVRTDTTGTVVITGSLSGSQEADTSVDDGIVVFDFSELVENTQYNLTITQGLDTQSCSVKTFPLSGSFNVCWWSCIDESYDFTPGLLMQKHNPTAVFDLGDVSYGQANALNPYGIVWIKANTNNGQPGGYDISDVWDHMRGGHQIPGRQSAERNSAYYFMPDDHDALAGNDWDHSIDQATVDTGGINLTDPTQAECDTHWWTVNQARRSYMKGNADTEAVSTVNDIPGESEEVAATHYPVNYFKAEISNTEFFMLDCISHRSALSDSDDENKTILGPTQKAWLIDAVIASTATFKIIVSTKKLYKLGELADNADTWAEYTTERDEILAAVASETGVLWISGDTHNATASWWTIDDIAGGEPPVIDFTSCPATKSFTTDIGYGYSGPVRWKISGIAGTTTGDTETNRLWSAYRVYGLLEITDNYIDISLIDFTGRDKIKRRLLAGSQTVVADENGSASVLNSI